MAKWGENDPRWIVNDREDGRNVNSWHWEEINLFTWSKDTITDLFKQNQGLQFTFDNLPYTNKVLQKKLEGKVRVKDVKEFGGEACINTRKNKKAFTMFDLKFSLDFEGTARHEDTDKKVEGQIKINEFSNANEPDEYVIEYTCKGGDIKLEEAVKASLATQQQIILDQLAKYVEAISQYEKKAQNDSIKR